MRRSTKSLPRVSVVWPLGAAALAGITGTWLAESRSIIGIIFIVIEHLIWIN
jgi:hypothetical protein